MLNAASKTKKFFSRAYDTPNPLWCLKPQEEMMAEYNIKSKEARKYIFNCLDDMARVNMPKYESSELQVEKVRFDSSERRLSPAKTQEKGALLPLLSMIKDVALANQIFHL